MPNVVGERFQITIDKQVREQLGILKKYTDQPIEPITDWEAYFDRAWAARAAEIEEVLEADSRRHGTQRRKRG